MSAPIWCTDEAKQMQLDPMLRKIIRHVSFYVCLVLVAYAAQITADTWQIVLVNLENFPQTCVPEAKEY